MLTIQHTPGLITLTGPIPQTATHKHHALQLSVARTGSIFLYDTPHTAVLIDADHPHALSADDAETFLIDPESHLADTLRTRFLQTTPLSTQLPVSWSPSKSSQHRLHSLAPQVCFDRHLEARIQKALDWLDQCEREERWLDVSLKSVLRQVHLSESRFLHLFKAETGIAWRPMLVWRRLLVALKAVASGMNLTQAAHAAGYADSAHFSRQCKANFGLTPRHLRKVSRFLQVS